MVALSFQKLAVIDFDLSIIGGRYRFYAILTAVLAFPRVANGLPALSAENKRELVRTYLLVAQPRSSGTFHTSALAELYGCHYTNELYHGSEEETKRNIRHALRHETNELTQLGYHVTPPQSKKLPLGHVPCTVFKIKPYDSDAKVSFLRLFDAVLEDLAEFENSGNATEEDRLVEAHTLLLLRQNVTEQVLSFAAMGVTHESYKKRDKHVEIPGPTLRFCMEEICQGRSWMGAFRDEYDALLTTEFIGTSNVAALPNERNLHYSELAYEPYSRQRFELDEDSNAAMKEFKSVGCSMFNVFSSMDRKAPNARFMFWGRRKGKGIDESPSTASVEDKQKQLHQKQTANATLPAKIINMKDSTIGSQLHRGSPEAQPATSLPGALVDNSKATSPNFLRSVFGDLS